MPLRRSSGGLSSSGNLFDRPGFFDVASIEALTVEATLLLQSVTETYGVSLTHAIQTGNYNLEIPVLSANDQIVTTTATQTLSNKTFAIESIYDANDNEQLILTPVASAVNYVNISNSATNNPPIIKALGDDANIDLRLEPKGTGKLIIDGDIDVLGTSTTINSTTLDVDDKNITMGSVAIPTDATASGGGITLKGASDKTILWDNSNANWTSNQDWNLETGKTFKITNVQVLSNDTLGTNVVNSSLEKTGALTSGSIAAGFGPINAGTAVITGGQLNIDNVRIDGNTISSVSGNLILDAVDSLNFSDDAVVSVGNIKLDSLEGAANAIQIGDNIDDAVSIYGVTNFEASGNLDIGSHNFTAGNILADSNVTVGGLGAGSVVFAGTNGILSDHSPFGYNSSTSTLSVTTLGATNINAFALQGNLTGGGNTISGTAFDIGGGNIDGTTLGATSSVIYAGGEITTDLTWTSAQTAIDVNSGTLNGITSFGIRQSSTSFDMEIAVSTATNITDSNKVLTINPNNAARTIDILGDLTFGNAFTTGSHALTFNTGGTTTVILPASGTLATLANSETLENKVLSSPVINEIVSSSNTNIALTPNGSGVVRIAGSNGVDIDEGSISIKNSGTVSHVRFYCETANAHYTQLQSAPHASYSGNAVVTLPSATSTLATTSLAETLTSKTLTTPTIGSFVNATHNHSIAAGGGTIAITDTTGTLAVNRGGTGATTLDNLITLGTHSTGNYVATVTGTANEIAVTGSGTETAGITIGLPTNVEIQGDLTVGGTTTTVNSTVVTIADPIFQIGGEDAPTSDDNKDRGIAFRWHNGTNAKNGFFGYDDDTGKFTFIPDATLTNEVVSGTAGTVVATTFEGALTGNADTADTATEATNVTVTANNSTNETTYLTFVDGYVGGTEGIETDSSLTYNPSTGTLSAGSFSGTIAGSTVEDNAITDIKLADMPANTIKVRNANSAGDPSNLVVGSAEIIIGDGTGFTAAALGGDVTMTNAGVVTIADGKIDGDMLLPTAITDHSEITTSSGVDTDEDMVMLWDQDANLLKSVKLANLGISGTAVGSASELQYNNSGSFAAAANVEIKNASLALKEMTAPNNVTGYGLLYAKSDNELYFKDDGGNETKITNGGSLAGGGAFKGIKAYLNANLSIANDADVTLGSGSYGSWAESYDVGGIHGTSPTNRFTFGVTGYFSISIQQEWAADSAGYRQIEVIHVDTSDSNTENEILVDRVVTNTSAYNSSSGSSTTIYVDDAADYIIVKVYQNSGAALNLIGGDDGTVVTITRVDTASASSVSSGGSGHIQLSDGSGGFIHDNNAIVWDSTNNRLGVNTANPAYTIDATASGTVRAATFTGNAATVTDGVYTTGTQTIGGAKTFSSLITGDISGNAGTVTGGVYTTGGQIIGGAKTFSTGATINVANEDLPLLTFEADMGTNNNRTLIISTPATDSASEPFRISTGNSLAFEIDGTQRMLINSSGNTTITGDTTLTGNLQIADSKEIRLGADDDLQIGHDVTSSYIKDLGTGVLYIDSNGSGIYMRKSDGTAMATLLTDGAVTLHHNGSARIATSATGATVTGALTTGDTTISSTGEATLILTSDSDANSGDTDAIIRFKKDGSGTTLFSTRYDQGNDSYTIADTNGVGWYFKTGGNLGIGTSAPDQKLTVGGHILLVGGDADNANKYSIIANEHYDTDDEEWVMMSGWSQAASHTLAFGGYDNGFNAATEMKFYTAANVTTRTGSERMVINSAGNVGIGTAPSYKLHVNGSTYLGGDSYLNHTGNKIEASASYNMITANGYMRLQSNGSVYVALDQDNGGTDAVFSVRANGSGTDVFSVSEAGQVKITGGSPGVDKVLTSNADGDATWEEVSAGGSAATMIVKSGVTVTQGKGVAVNSDGEAVPFDFGTDLSLFKTNKELGPFIQGADQDDSAQGWFSNSFIAYRIMFYDYNNNKYICFFQFKSGRASIAADPVAGGDHYIDSGTYPTDANGEKPMNDLLGSGNEIDQQYTWITCVGTINNSTGDITWSEHQKVPMVVQPTDANQSWIRASGDRTALGEGITYDAEYQGGGNYSAGRIVIVYDTYDTTSYSSRYNKHIMQAAYNTSTGKLDFSTDYVYAAHDYLDSPGHAGFLGYDNSKQRIMLTKRPTQAGNNNTGNLQFYVQYLAEFSAGNSPVSGSGGSAVTPSYYWQGNGIAVRNPSSNRVALWGYINVWGNHYHRPYDLSGTTLSATNDTSHTGNNYGQSYLVIRGFQVLKHDNGTGDGSGMRYMLAGTYNGTNQFEHFQTVGGTGSDQFDKASNSFYRISSGAGNSSAYYPHGWAMDFYTTDNTGEGAKGLGSMFRYHGSRPINGSGGETMYGTGDSHSSHNKDYYDWKVKKYILRFDQWGAEGTQSQAGWGTAAGAFTTQGTAVANSDQITTGQGLAGFYKDPFVQAGSGGHGWSHWNPDAEMFVTFKTVKVPALYKDDNNGVYTSSSTRDYYQDNYVHMIIDTNSANLENNITCGAIPGTYVGLAKTTVAGNGSDTVDVNIVGAVDTNQSGLVPGQPHYMNHYGTVLPYRPYDSWVDIEVGTAISASTLIIANNQNAYPHGTTLPTDD